MDLEIKKEHFLQELSQVLDEYYFESAYPTKLKEHTKQMIDHLMPTDHGYSALSFLVPTLAKILKTDLSDEKIQMANTLGWIFTMYQASHLCIDDFVDEGNTRYGKATWSKLQNHSKRVMLSDGSNLRAVIYFILEKKFSNSPTIYLDLVRLFHRCDRQASRMYRLDAYLLIENLRNGKTSLESFNMETYKLMSLKVGSIFFSLPMALAMVIAGFQLDKHQELYNKIEIVGGDIGYLHSVNDDYHDSFSPNPSGFDAADTDIKRGQFTWCLLTAMSHLTTEDEVTDLFSHYGLNTDESVTYVKAIYEKIGIHKLVVDCRVQVSKNIEQKIQNLEENREVKQMAKFFFDWGNNVEQG